jgi:diguanylate cyclase (GGDEF)-like protein
MTGLSHRRQLTVAVAVVTIAVVASVLWLVPLIRPQGGNIRQLQTIPVGARASMEGVVTYTDPAGKSFWIQDDTGAVEIPEDPGKVGVRVGQLIRVQATKVHAYDPLIGYSSVALKDVKVRLSKKHVQLPAPVVSSLRAFSKNEKTGIRVQLSGVVHRVTRDELGRMHLVFGDMGREGLATIPNNVVNPSRWLDARVRLIGVSVFDPGGWPTNEHVLVASSDDIQVEEPTPEVAPLMSVRSLYRDGNGQKAHLVRMRGRVVARATPTSLMLEDRWGAIACESDEAQKFAPGTAVEIAGYPVAGGLRLDLWHCFAHPIPEREVEEASRGENPPVLTTVAAIRQLSESAARTALPAKITAVITYNDPLWKQIILQDSTGGMFVKYSESLGSLERGQLVTVTGVTGPGDYAPVLVGARVVGQGKATWFPRPVQVASRDASSGILDSQYAEVEGVIHPFNPDGDYGRLTFELYSSFGQLHIYTAQELEQALHFPNPVDARVRIRGVFGTVFNSRRQLVGYQMAIASANDIEVLEPAAADPFQQTAVAIRDLLRYSSHADNGHRIKVQGSVTMIGKGFFYLQDESGGLHVLTDSSPVHLGNLVEVVGYASVGGGYSPVLSDAIVRVVRPVAPVSPRVVSAEALSQGQYDSQLVTLDGRLLNAVDTLHGKSLVLQSGTQTFNAQLDTAESAQPLPDLVEGSILRLTGVCSVQVNSSKLYRLLDQGLGALEFKLMLPTSQDLRVERRASWWTASHSLALAGVLSATILLVLSWVSMLRQRVHHQMGELRKASAQADAVGSLANAMREVAKREDFEARVAVQRQDDIGQLGIEFNHMLSQLEERDHGKKEAERKLQIQALTDELTGLPNRRLLYDRLTQTLALGKRENKVVALLYIDLDGFKLVNDSLGHGVGDLLLGEVAVRLRSRIRLSDTLARIGGDEFTVVLATRASEEAKLVAHKLLDVLEKPFLIEGHEITISASIGISFFPDNGADGGTLLQQADSAMYVAKRNGKNQMACFTSEMGSLVRERMNLESQLRVAIGRGEIMVHYQPEFDVISGRLIRFEALARWTHATLGEIPPTKFIPIAEESGMILPLGAYIMECACAEAVKWQTMSAYPIQVAVNVSSLQFMRDTFVDETAEILRHSGLEPGLLQIELTESVMLSGVNRAAKTMKRLSDLGISLAIDDFGTGYSCLSYLPKLAFDALKIDRSFVADLESRPETKALVLSLVTLAHNLNMRVIVEGVETEEQMDLIRKYGGNEVQGFLLGRPSADPESQIRLAQSGTLNSTVPEYEAVLPAPS